MPKIEEFCHIYKKMEHHAAQAPALRERDHNFRHFYPPLEDQIIFNFSSFAVSEFGVKSEVVKDQKGAAMNRQSAYRKFAAMMLQEDSEYIPQILKCMINDAQA